MGLIGDMKREGMTGHRVGDAVRFVEKLDGTEGTTSIPGVGYAGAVHEKAHQAGLVVVMVKVTGNLTGGGKYTGRILQQPVATALTKTGNLALTDFGVAPSADDCYVINSPEVAASTHDLTAGTPKTTIFPAALLPKLSSDGKYVAAILGYDWEACT